MRTTLLLISTLIIGLIAGTVYGWTTGYDDGQIVLQSTNFALIQKYAISRTTADIEAQDKLIDFLAVGCGVTFANNPRYSPMRMFTQPKADQGLLAVAAYWELNSHEPNTRSGSEPTTPFRPGSPEADRLAQLNREWPDGYQQELNRQKKARQSIPSVPR